MARRVCLINSVLSAIPLYYLSFLRMLALVHKKLIAIQRRFLWGMDEGTKQICWVKWETITSPKSLGGLGIKDMKCFNASLLAKWRWNLFYQKDTLWSRILDSKYGGHGSLGGGQRGRQHRFWSEWWRDLQKCCGSHEQSQWFDKIKRWKIGNGGEINFWEDVGIGEESLLQKVPRVYVNSKQQSYKLADMGCWEGEDWHWQFQWRRNWLERDQEQWTFFQHAVSTVALQKHAKDRWVWPIDKSGCFSVSSTYKALHDLKYNGQVDDLLAHIWHMKIPPKAVILQWRLLHNALPSVDNLLRRGIVLPPLDSMCVMCNEQPETLPHFFFSCSIADQLWKYYFSWASISTVQPQTMRLHYCQYPQLCSPRPSRTPLSALDPDEYPLRP
uniref:Ribonuclease H protein At1g65750 n=1 Tax=Cajanus cajan TaxID=3821 RepID=A0A151UAN8_CAJCA|nr:Putative ribonuclease H protein At1g65750 [Cajanus cajan]